MKSHNAVSHKRSSLLAARRMFVVLLFLLVPVVSHAVDVTGTSSTYLLSRQKADETSSLPLYEYLNFSVQDADNNPVTAHFGGWGRYDFKTSNTYLQYGYIRYARIVNNAAVNLGRIMVFEGVARELVDGVSARTDLVGGFGLSAFGGIPVETGIVDPGYVGNNVIYGARLSQQSSDIYRIGVSYLKEEKNAGIFREEQGVDLWLRPLQNVDILGKSSYNAATDGWMEHNYALTVGPFYKLTLGADISMISYQDLFSSLTSSEFAPTSLFRVVDLREKLTATGVNAALRVTDRITLSGEYKQYEYDIAGAASSMGGGISFSSAGSYAAGASYRRMDAEDSPEMRYHEYRFYGFLKRGKTDVGIDVFDVIYDRKINGVGEALSASLVAGYELTEQLKLGADFEYAKNPDFDQDVRAFIKALYKFGARKGA